MSKSLSPTNAETKTTSSAFAIIERGKTILCFIVVLCFCVCSGEIEGGKEGGGGSKFF